MDTGDFFQYFYFAWFNFRHIFLCQGTPFRCRRATRMYRQDFAKKQQHCDYPLDTYLQGYFILKKGDIRL
jgi:hypothetical protein